MCSNAHACGTTTIEDLKTAWTQNSVCAENSSAIKKALHDDYNTCRPANNYEPTHTYYVVKRSNGCGVYIDTVNGELVVDD
jgi:hypothetical protein